MIRTSNRPKPIDMAQLLKYLQYDPVSGLFTHKHRHDNPSFNTQFAGKTAGVTLTRGPNAYILLTVKRNRCLAHRAAWLICNGSIPTGKFIDHIDGDGTNNKIQNLRLVTALENSQNSRMPVNNKTGVSGVSMKNNGKFYVRANINRVSVYGGTADTIEEAIVLRDRLYAEAGFHENHGKHRRRSCQY